MKRLLINLITVILLLVVIEIISRAVLSKIYNRDFDSSLIVDNKYFDSPGLKPNAHGKVWGKDFNTDEYGGRRITGSKTAARKTLYIGDSVTEGVGVDDSSTFISGLSDIVLNKQLNISLIGYSTSDYLNVVRHFGGDTNITHVVVFYCLNDVYGKSKTNDLPVMGRQGVIGSVSAFLQKYYATYKLLKLWVYKNSSSYFKYDLQFYKQGDVRLAEAMDNLKACDSICKSTGVEFTLCLLPYRSQLQGGFKGNFAPQQMILDYCRDNRIACRDIAPALENERPQDLYLFADEIHFSEAGHRAIAGFLKELK